jgi:hypothetical protein
MNTTRLPGGDKGLIRVIATDGFHTATDDSDEVFEVQAKPPVVTIKNPADGDVFPSDRRIKFNGDAIDYEDEILPKEAFTWFLDNKTIGTGRNVYATLPTGLHEITLRAMDSSGKSDQTTVTIEVFLAGDHDGDGDGYTEKQGDCDDEDADINPGVDEICDGLDNNCNGDIDEDLVPPEISVSVTPTVLWPPNHKMVEVVPTVTVVDNCDPNPVVELTSITMNEGESENTFDLDFDVDPSVGYVGDDIKIESEKIFLRAERAGNSDGRVYTITYRVTDMWGNSSTASTTVIVPHNQ